MLSPFYSPLPDYWKQNPLVSSATQSDTYTLKDADSGTLVCMCVCVHAHACVCVCVMDPMLCIFLRQCPVVSEVAAGSFKEKSPPEICAKGYVVRTLEAALWAFYHTDSFKDGCLKVGELRKGWQTDLVVLLATMRLTTPTCSHLSPYQSPSPPGTLGIGAVA